MPSDLIVVPLPDAGGPLTLFQETRDGPEATGNFEMLRRQLLQLDDLALVVIDPLSAFASGDLNASTTFAQFLCGTLSQLAADTGAAVILT